MKRYRNLVLVFVIFIFIGFLGLSAWSSGVHSNKLRQNSDRQKSRVSETDIQAMAARLRVDDIPVSNMTRSFRLLKLEKIEDRDLRLTFQNDYDKEINGFQVSIGNVGTQVELIYNEEHMIKPGDTWVEVLPIQAYTDTQGIGILAVTFEDGSKDGNAMALRQIKEKRAGEKVQIKRALTLIRASLKSPDTNTPAMLEQLESQIKALPENGNTGQSGDFKLGLNSAKQRMVSIVQAVKEQLDQSSTRDEDKGRAKKTSTQKELGKILDRYERIISNR